jgi:hypothetical protein
MTYSGSSSGIVKFTFKTLPYQINFLEYKVVTIHQNVFIVQSVIYINKVKKRAKNVIYLKKNSRFRYIKITFPSRVTLPTFAS